MENADWKLSVLTTRWGRPGRVRFTGSSDTLLKAADDAMTFKYLVKNAAWQVGKSATFMPKPLFGENGSGMHVHQSIWKNGKHSFKNEGGYAGLSDMARWYIGGLLKQCVFPACVHESDRELVSPFGPRFRGSDLVGLLQGNRSAAIRIP
jgi:glutamine synthetase